MKVTFFNQDTSYKNMLQCPKSKFNVFCWMNAQKAALNENLANLQISGSIYFSQIVAEEKNGAAIFKIMEWLYFAAFFLILLSISVAYLIPCFTCWFFYSPTNGWSLRQPLSCWCSNLPSEVLIFPSDVPLKLFMRKSMLQLSTKCKWHMSKRK